MLLNKWEPYYYSRPISYRSYYPRQQKPEILKVNDKESQEVVNFLKQKGVTVNDLGGLGRGIRFQDWELGRRRYEWNREHGKDQWFIHQWKPTNDRPKWHPVGTHLVFKSYPEFMAKLNEIFVERAKKY